jgi:hypothetical protein
LLLSIWFDDVERQDWIAAATAMTPPPRHGGNSTGRRN